MANGITQATVVSQSAAKRGQESMQLALFHTDGTALAVGKKMPAQVDSVAADLTAMKVDFNALLAKLRTAGLMT